MYGTCIRGCVYTMYEYQYTIYLYLYANAFNLLNK